jgi:hypothetical protein
LPILSEFVSMRSLPLRDESQSTFGEFSSDDFTRLDINGGVILTLYSVEMRISVIAIEKADDNPEKATHLGHSVRISLDDASRNQPTACVKKWPARRAAQ